MQARGSKWRSRLLLVLVCAGLLGAGGCKRTFHAQQSHAIGGGTVGKGWATPPVRRTEGRAGIGDAPGPMAGLFDAKRGKRSAKALKSSSGGAQRKATSSKRRPAKRSILSAPGSPFDAAAERRKPGAAR